VRSWSGFILLALYLAIFPAPTPSQVRSPVPAPKPGTPAAPAVVKIRYEDGLVTAQLKDAPLPRVLEEFAARTGVVFEVGVHDVTAVTLGLYRVPLDEAITRIAGLNNAILYYEKDSTGANRITFVRILARFNKPAQPSLRYIGTGTITKTGEDQVETQEQALKVLTEKGSLEARQKAIEVLVAAKGDLAVTALAIALTDEAPEVRVAAIEGLAALQARLTLPGIVAALKDVHPGVRQSAIVAVALLGDTDNLKDIRPLTKDPDASVAAAAETAVRKLSPRRP
jgi:hypothetical protein